MMRGVCSGFRTSFLCLWELILLTPRQRYSGLSLFWDKPFEELYKDIDETPEYERRREVRSRFHLDFCRHRSGREGLTHTRFSLDIQQRSRSHGQAHDVHQGDVGQGSGCLRPSELQ